MARLRSTTPSTRLTRDAARLVALALALHSSGSRVEDRYWEAELANVLLKLMRNHHDGAIDMVLMIENTKNKELRNFGEKIVKTQSAEIEQMRQIIKRIL